MTLRPGLTPMYSAAAIAERVNDMAATINRDFANADMVHVIVTLNGAFIFAADLIRKLNIPLMVHFAGGGTQYEGQTRRELALQPEALPHSFGNQPVIILEDLMDGGNTVTELRKLCVERSCGALKVAALLKRQGADGTVDYYGFTLPKGVFVVGYGMDMDGLFREMGDVAALGTAVQAGVC